MGEFESFIGINFWTALFTLLNFLALFFVLKRFLAGPVRKIIQERQKEIDDLYANAGSAQEKAQALESEYRKKLDLAAQTSEGMVREAVERGRRKEEEILRAANAEAAAIMDKAAVDIALEKKKAMNEAKDEITDMAMAIAEKVVGRELNSADQQGLVEKFINDLGDQV